MKSKFSFFIYKIAICVLTSLSFISISYSQSLIDQLNSYNDIYNTGVKYWQLKPADFKSALVYMQTYADSVEKILQINPRISFEEQKFVSFQTYHGMRHYVRFMENLKRINPNLFYANNCMEKAWNMTEKIRSFNYRYDLLKGLLEKYPQQTKDSIIELFDNLYNDNSHVKKRILTKKLVEIFPEYEILWHKQEKMSEVKGLLQGDELLLSFFFNDNGRPVFVWKFEKKIEPQLISLNVNTAEFFFRIEMIKAINEKDTMYQEFITSIYTFISQGKDPYSKLPFKPILNDISSNIRAISEVLFTQIDISSKKKIIISTDQNVSSLPFDLLLKNDTPLINTHTIRYVPSVKLLSFLKSRNKDKAPNSYLSYLAFGYDDYDNMPNANYELNDCASKFVKSDTNLNSTESNIYNKCRLKKNVDVIHFSTHSGTKLYKSEFTDYTRQHLLFYPDKENDGLLNSDEIVKEFNIKPSLVILSSCETAPSADIKDFISLYNNKYAVIGCVCNYGETFSNLTSSFFALGADNIIATQWKVSPEATRRFFDLFTSNINYYQDVNDALILTKQKLKVEYPSSDWAGFILIGL